MTTENQIPIFICTGCSISESLDINELQSFGAENSSVASVFTDPCWCNQDGRSKILNALESFPEKKMILAACSPRVKAKEFDFGESVTVERINFREQLAWCHEPLQEDTQMMASDYLRMGLAKLSNTTRPLPFIPEEASADLLILGGGITGLTAALAAAKAGFSATVVEQEQQLGGFLKHIHKKLPDQAPWLSPGDNPLPKLLLEISEEPGIEILTESSIASVSGQPGEFTASIAGKNKKTLKVGSLILANGWKPYDAHNLNEFGYGRFPQVITSTEAEQQLKNGILTCPGTDRAPQSVLFIQCAGSRDAEHLPYCSSVCCGTSLKQAQMIREQHPNTNVYVIYKDIRMPGLLEQYYHEVQKDSRIFLTKGKVEQIAADQDLLKIRVSDTLIHDEIEISADLVVLATGMVPNNSKDLNLNYRQGPGLPDLKYDFPDSHFICFPYETRRTGIFAAGAIRAPMSIKEAQSDARGAALKAIQMIKSVKTGRAVHPRSGDQSHPQLYMQRCTDCKRCTEECPFGMYDETEKGTPLPNPTRCRRCGICMGSCPERIISFEDYSIQSVSAMIKAIEVPDEFEEKPRILAFVCENDAYPAFDMAGQKRLRYSAYLRIIPVRCIGSINKIWISDALSQGFDGILQIGCKPGDDYQCHFIQGSALTETRGENLQETLQTMMLEPERIKTEFLEINEFQRIPELIDAYIEEIEMIGPNPFKDL